MPAGQTTPRATQHRSTKSSEGGWGPYRLRRWVPLKGVDTPPWDRPHIAGPCRAYERGLLPVQIIRACITDVGVGDRGVDLAPDVGLAGIQRIAARRVQLLVADRVIDAAHDQRFLGRQVLLVVMVVEAVLQGVERLGVLVVLVVATGSEDKRDHEQRAEQRREDRASDVRASSAHVNPMKSNVVVEA